MPAVIIETSPQNWDAFLLKIYGHQGLILVPFFSSRTTLRPTSAHLRHFHAFSPSNIWIPPEKSNIQRKRIRILILTLQEMQEFTIFHFFWMCPKIGYDYIPKILKKKTLEPDYKPISSTNHQISGGNLGVSIILPSSFPSFWDQRDPLDQFFNLRSQARGFRLTNLNWN